MRSLLRNSGYGPERLMLLLRSLLINQHSGQGYKHNILIIKFATARCELVTRLVALLHRCFMHWVQGDDIVVTVARLSREGVT